MYSKDLKSVAIRLYYKFNSFRKVANLINISKSTIHRWLNNITYKKNKSNTISQIEPFIKKLLDNDSYITLKIIQTKIKNKFNFTYSLSFIHTFIRRKLKYSFKKVSKKLFSKNLKSLLMKQKTFHKHIKNTNKLISIDESYIHSNYCYKYGWSPVGQKLIKFVKTNPTKYSILMAISNTKIVSYEIHTGNINTSIFYKFINKLNTKFKNTQFLMDNVSFHKSKIITDLFINSSNELLFIPPYSPHLNPIEEVFSQIKRNYFNFSRGDTLYKLKKSIRTVKKRHLENYYKNSFPNITNR